MSHLLGGEITEEQISAARFNAKTIFVGTGDEIANITLTSTIPFAKCTEDGSGFINNHIYQRHFDPAENGWTGWDDVFRKHTHADDTESEGGDYYDIDIANWDALSIRRPSLTEEYFLADVSGSGASVTHAAPGGNQRIVLTTSTGASTGTPKWAQVQDGGIKASFSSRMEWHSKFAVEGAATGILWRMGVQMERVQENSEATLQKFGIEGCAGDGNTIQLVSCNGSGIGADRVKTNTAVTYGTATSMGVKIEYTPSTSVIYYDTNGTIKPSAGGFPNSGPVNSDSMLRYGVKATTSDQKWMYIWADALFGKILDPAAWI